MPQQNIIRIIIAEDHALVRKGLKSLISSQAEFDVVAEAENGIQALDLTHQHQPDLILLDLSMPKMNGLATMRQLKKEHSQVKILVITMHASQDYLIPTLKAGADGYLLKGDDPQELFAAIKTIMAGKAYLSTDLSGQLISTVLNPDTPTAQDPLAQLTQREREVFQLVAEGGTNQQIGDLLFISPKTVDKHRTNLMKKLDLHSAREVTTYAVSHGVIPTP